MRMTTGLGCDEGKPPSQDFSRNALYVKLSVHWLILMLHDAMATDFQKKSDQNPCMKNLNVCNGINNFLKRGCLKWPFSAALGDCSRVMISCEGLILILF